MTEEFSTGDTVLLDNGDEGHIVSVFRTEVNARDCAAVETETGSVFVFNLDQLRHPDVYSRNFRTLMREAGELAVQAVDDYLACAWEDVPELSESEYLRAVENVMSAFKALLNAGISDNEQVEKIAHALDPEHPEYARVPAQWALEKFRGNPVY